MASVYLNFLPPERAGFTKLYIFEGATPDAVTTLIETVTVVGEYPDYISEYSTSNAISKDDYFAIQWEDDKGVQTNISAPIKGGSSTLVGELVRRVIVRNSSFAEEIVLEEAEGVVSFVYNVDDPYSIDYATVNRLWLTELTTLVYVACQYLVSLQTIGSSSSYSAGVYSESTSVNTQNILDTLQKLEQRALRRIGIGGSRIASFEWQDRRKEFYMTGEKVAVDMSRLLQVKEIVTERILQQDIPTGFTISVD